MADGPDHVPAIPRDRTGTREGDSGGMQNSLNSLLSLLMFFLVIALPKPEHFGLLALMSVCAVGTGGLLYASFSYKIRGHDDDLAMIRGLLSTRNENCKY